jgi:hypothetical protein
MRHNGRIDDRTLRWLPGANPNGSKGADLSNSPNRPAKAACLRSPVVQFVAIAVKRSPKLPPSVGFWPREQDAARRNRQCEET